MPDLLIISHTEHYYDKNKNIVGWEPTIREINYYTKVFDNIYHIAPLYSKKPHLATIQYSSQKIRFIPIVPSGGKNIFQKLKIFFLMPIILFPMLKMINKVDYVHFRAPTNFGLFLLPILSLYNKKVYWVKYAGNWIQKEVPFSYRIQRWWLKNLAKNSVVTINGHWHGQKKHLLSFENPCIDEKELKFANQIANKKVFNKSINICFIGKQDQNKGFNNFIESIFKIRKFNKINEIDIVGDISDKTYKSKLKNVNLKIKFHGWLNRSSLNKIYERSHLIILPTYSEGIPKVIIEASAYGCIPVVTNLAPINQYVINGENGLLINFPLEDDLINCILNIEEDIYKLNKLSIEATKIAQLFTYEKYIIRIKKEIIHA